MAGERSSQRIAIEQNQAEERVLAGQGHQTLRRNQDGKPPGPIMAALGAVAGATVTDRKARKPGPQPASGAASAARSNKRRPETHLAWKRSAKTAFWKAVKRRCRTAALPSIQARAAAWRDEEVRKNALTPGPINGPCETNRHT